MIVESPNPKVHRITKLLLDADPAAVALGRRQDVLVRREVEPIGLKERPQFSQCRSTVRRVGDREIPEWSAGDRPSTCSCVEPPVGGRAAASPNGVEAARLPGIRELRDCAVARIDRLLLGVVRPEDNAGPRRLNPIARLVILRVAIALAEGAELRRGAQPLLLLDGDDVDDAGDRIRTVERRRAGLEDFDAIDHVRRNGVEVDRAGNAAGACAVDEAQTVDQHQGTVGAEVAQVDRRGTRADAAAVRRIAEVATGVDLGVEAAARARDALEHVGDRGKAGLSDVCLIDEDDRRILIERVAPDARSGDDYFAL